MKTFIFLSSNGEVCHMLLAHAVKLAKRSDRRANVLVVTMRSIHLCLSETCANPEIIGAATCEQGWYADKYAKH